MSNPNQFLLLGQRKFLPLFVTQFLGAFHDNLFKNALVVLIIYQLATELGIDTKTQQLLTTLAAGVLILPFFLFSAMGGQLADKFPKEIVMQKVKLFEIFIAIMGAISLLSASLLLSFVTIFALGTHSAIFAPSKYSILPQHLNQNELIGGNAILNTGTFLAILCGTIIGTIVMGLTGGIIIISILMFVTAIIGYIASLKIPHAPPKAANIKVSYNIFKETWAVMKYTLSQPRDITLAMLGKAWFFLIGSMFMAQFANFTKINLGGNEHILTLFLVLFAIGIALGGLCNNRLLKGKISAVFVPLAALGLSIFSFDIYYACLNGYRPPEGILIGVSQFLSHSENWRIILDVFMVAFFGGLYVVPLSAIIQDRTPAETRARIMAGSSILDSAFMVFSAVISAVLIGMGWTIPELFFAFAVANAVVAVYICRLLPDYLFKTILQIIFKAVYKVEIKGLENIEKAGSRAVIIGNHVSLLDPPLLAAFLPGKPMFAVNTQVANWWWVKPFLNLVDAFPIDPTNPYALKALIRKVEEDRHIVIFPEGRLTDTGSLMKIYDGPGMIADKADAMILPIRLDGVQHTKFARLKGKVPLMSFPKITITILEPRQFKINPNLKGRARRAAASKQLYDVMEEMMFVTSDKEQTLWNALLKAYYTNGQNFKAVEDVTFSPLTYRHLVQRSTILGKYLAKKTKSTENVGILLPNSVGSVVTFFALQSIGRVAAMLNFTSGEKAILSALLTANIQLVLTSKRFIELANLGDLVASISKQATVRYLEDIKDELSLTDKLSGIFSFKTQNISADSPAVILFTSGSEGNPKGVALSHNNLLSNIIQLASRVDFNQSDIVFNCLPMFHSFGLTGGTLLPVLSGVKTFLYPSPLHYRIVPELVYATNATIMFGTDTFLSGYGRMANNYDFYRMRYIFAGAEKIKDTTRQLYMERFGVRIFEGYGTTETSPVIAVNSPLYNKPGTVGRILSGITAKLEKVDGVDIGGRLMVKGSNVMLGYYKDDLPGILQPPEEGWHDTGDIVTIDEDGFIKIQGRAKRFAKIAGEMVSLSVTEGLAQAVWPNYEHAVVSIPDERKGERLVLVTTHAGYHREELSSYAARVGITALAIPAVIIFVEKIPLLGTGKTDYVTISRLAHQSQ
jgi:acyl-[acyl-carrier-protein]-phospholipid O-acyltransferase/long-chain-fatty-acid--[acyl-carrier-protein] ligase